MGSEAVVSRGQTAFFRFSLCWRNANTKKNGTPTQRKTERQHKEKRKKAVWLRETSEADLFDAEAP